MKRHLIFGPIKMALCSRVPMDYIRIYEIQFPDILMITRNITCLSCLKELRHKAEPFVYCYSSLLETIDKKIATERMS